MTYTTLLELVQEGLAENGSDLGETLVRRHLLKPGQLPILEREAEAGLRNGAVDDATPAVPPAAMPTLPLSGSPASEPVPPPQGPRYRLGKEIARGGLGRVVVASACSGHGFKFAPALGVTIRSLVEEALYSSR